MGKVGIEAEWLIETPLHLGTGLSRPGYADRIVQKRSDGRAELNGEAFKSVVRGAAERLLRWYATLPEESWDKSYPNHPLLERLFANSGAVRYRFPMRAAVGANGQFRAAGTKLELGTGVAASKTLRLIENHASQTQFDVRIDASGGDFRADSQDLNDLHFLALCLLAGDGVGGKRTSGLGEITCKSLSVTIDSVDEAVKAEQVDMWIDEFTAAYQEVPAP